MSETTKEKKPIFKRWWFWVIVVVVLVGIISSQGDKNKENPTPSKKKQEQEVTYTKLDLGSFVKEFDENEVAAEKKYSGTYGEFTGYIDNINKDIVGSTYITINPTNQDLYIGGYIQCYIQDEDSILNLKKGDNVTIQGKIGEKTILSIPVKECKVI